MNKKHLSSKCLSYVAVAALLAGFQGGVRAVFHRAFRA